MNRVALIVAACAALLGCGGAETQPHLLDAQADADSSNTAGIEATGETEALFALTAADPDAATSDDELAVASAEEAARQFSRSCISAAIDRNIVTYTLVECTGPFGFVTISGELVAIYTLTPEGVRAEITGLDLAVNEGTASVAAIVLHSWSGTTHTIEVDTNWQGTTKDGEATSRVGDYVSTIDPVVGCVTLDGDWTTAIGALSWNTVVTAFKVCRGQCPADGGSIEWEGPNTTTTVEYDGTRTAHWSNTNGSSGTVQLRCG